MGKYRKYRRTKSGQEQSAGEKKKSWISKKTIWAGILIGIMVLSGAGFYYGSQSQQVALEYNGHEFTQEQGWFMLHWEREKIPFANHPAAVEHLEVDPSIVEKLRNVPQLQFTFNPEMDALDVIDLTRFEMQAIFPRYLNMYVVEGVTAPSTQYLLPIITCTNATQYLPVLLVNQSNQTGIRLEGDCILLEGTTPFDIVRWKDRLVYGLLGVI